MFPDSDMIGKRFGRGVVQKFAYSRGRAKVWELLCDCGKTYYCDQAGADGTHNMCTNGKSRVMSTSTDYCTVFGEATGGYIRME